MVAYLSVLALLLPFGLHRLRLLWLRFARAGRDEAAAADDAELPRLTVQVPVFNEANVVERAVDAACRIDWPHDRLEVQVLDDSTDETTELAARRAAAWRARGLDVRHLRRDGREGFKAGALAHGVERAAGELFLVLDADFVPPPELARRLAPAFHDPRVGFVQAAWDHLNPDEGWLTRGQALLLDAHFAVEHEARHRGDLFFNFNGTAGMWRRRCLEAVGGWSGATVTEDLELSYRAQLGGWRGRYRDRVRAPAELPSTLRALEVQQERWTRGGVQTARRLLPRVWRSGFPLRVKAEATAHLTGHLVHPLTLMLALALAWPGTVGGVAAAIPGWAHAAAVSLAVLPFFLYFGAADVLRGRGGLGTVGRVLQAVGLGIGLSPPLTLAALRGLRADDRPDFDRTPKEGASGRRRYRLQRRPFVTGVRLVLGVALLVSTARLALEGLPAGAAFHALFAFGFLGTAVAGRREDVGSAAEGREQAASPELARGQQREQGEVDEGGEGRRVGPGAGRQVGVASGVGEEQQARPHDPRPRPPQGGEGEDPEGVPRVDGGREEEGGAHGPEQRPRDAPAAQRGADRDGAHDRGRRDSGGPAEDGLQEGEEGRVEAPAGRVLAQAREQVGAGPRVRQVEQRRYQQTHEGGARPASASERGERGQGGELHRRAEPQQAAGEPPVPVPGQEEERRHHGQQPERLEVPAPRDLHEDQRRPEPEEQRDGGAVAARRRQPVQHRRHAEVRRDPRGLEERHRRTEEREEGEDGLGAGRVDGRDVRVVHQRPPIGGQGIEGRVRRGVRERVDAVDGDVAVPEVAPQVLREVGQQRQEGQPPGDADPPQDGAGAGRIPRREGPERPEVAGPGQEPEEEGRRRGGPQRRHAGHGPERADLEETGREEREERGARPET